MQKAAEYVDIFLIDYKYALAECANYMGVPNYPQVATKAIDFCLKKIGNLQLDENGKATRGTLIRHLVLPTFVDNSIEVLNNLYFDYGTDVYLSIMSQYDPVYLLPKHERLSRKLTKEEYDQVLDLVNDFGFDNVFIQDLPEDKDEYTPDFDTKDNFGKF